jgi:hypothetical protein
MNSCTYKDIAKAVKVCPVQFIHVHYMYIDNQGEIEQVKDSKYILKDAGILHKNEVSGLIKEHMYLNEVKYRVLSILKFNMVLSPNQLEQFVSTDMECVSFLQSMNSVEDMHFQNTIDMFQDLNDVFILFYNKPPPLLDEDKEKEKGKDVLKISKQKTKKRILQYLLHKTKHSRRHFIDADKK